MAPCVWARAAHWPHGTVPVNVGSLHFWPSVTGAVGHGAGPILKSCMAAVGGLQRVSFRSFARICIAQFQLWTQAGCQWALPYSVPVREIPRHITYYLIGTALSLGSTARQRDWCEGCAKASNRMTCTYFSSSFYLRTQEINAQKLPDWEL